MTVTKLQKMVRFVPGLFGPATNPYVKGLLYAWSLEDDAVVEAAREAKNQLFVRLANLQFLDALGSNVGVFRPTAVNLSDDQFRDLIPTLSFYPKQVKPTIKKVLDIFFGEGNPITQVTESRPNELTIQIPSSVPSLRRTLRGSHHFHAYNGVVDSVDNIGKVVTVTFSDEKEVLLNEVINAAFGVDNKSFFVISNTAGNTGVSLQFGAASDLSSINVGDKFCLANVKKYYGSFFKNPSSAYSVTSSRGTLGQAIVAGNIYPTLTMSDASNIPDSPGRLIFNFGKMNQEAEIKYFGRPNNSTLLLDPSYIFTKDHSSGEVVNVIVKPSVPIDQNGGDYGIYLVGVTAARTLAQQIVESVIAIGIVINWQIVEPKC